MAQVDIARKAAARLRARSETLTEFFWFEDLAEVLDALDEYLLEHDPTECEHEQCGHAHEAGYIAGRRATVDDLRRLADSLAYQIHTDG